MLVSSNKTMVDKVRFWSTQSRDQARHYQHSEIGYNYRMSNISAGIGRGQLKVLNSRISKNAIFMTFYKRELRNIEANSFMPESTSINPNYWLSVILLKDYDTNRLIDELEKRKY